MKTKTKTKNARVFVSIIGLCTHVFLMKGQSGKSCEKKIHSFSFRPFFTWFFVLRGLFNSAKRNHPKHRNILDIKF